MGKRVPSHLFFTPTIAFFTSAEDALVAGMNVRHAINRAALPLTGDENYGVSMGIGFGRLLSAGPKDGYFGDEMNTSFSNLTAIYCSLLAIWLFVLSIRVIGLRGNPAFAFIAQGKGDEELLNRAIRAQGNLIEYAPIMLFILFFLEASRIPELAVRILGDGFLLGRLMHGTAMGFMRSNMPLRVGGMILTLLPLLVGAIALFLQSKPF